MRHCYFRILMGLVWLVAAIVSAVKGNISMAVMYAALGVVFAYTAYTIWNKEKSDGR